MLIVFRGSLSTGTAVRLTGSWRPSPNPKAQSHELHVAGVDILGTSDPAVCKDCCLNYSKYVLTKIAISDIPIAEEIPYT